LTTDFSLRLSFMTITKEKIMNTEEILKVAITLKPEDRFMVVDGLIKSLDAPDKNIDDIWIEEAENRLKAYRNGRLKGMPMEEVFSE